MNQIINFFLEWLNNVGRWFWDYSAGMFIQVSLLIIVLLAVDFLLRKRVRAVFRYCVWMLVFVKLILPPTLCLPTGIGYWYGGYLSTDSPVLQQVSSVVRPEPAGALAPEDFALAAEVPQDQPSQVNTETAAPVTSAVSGLETLTWQAVVFGLWLVGVFVISVLLIQRMLFVKGLIAQSEPSDDRLEEMISKCRRQVGVHRNIESRLSNSISGPAVCGLFKPVILIPTALLEKLSPDRLRAVLVHELVHIKRADIWVNLVQTVLQIIYFYNPFVWLANAVVRSTREQAVDEMVLVALGSGAKSYSNTLIDIAEMAFWKTSLSLRLIGVVESKKALHRRIRHMLNRPIPKNARLGFVGLFAIIITSAVLLPMAKAQKDLDLVEVGQVSEQFTAILPNGVEVELVGICEDPTIKGRQWWRLNGMEMKEPEYELRGKQGFKYPAFGYLLKFSPWEDLNYRSKINLERLFMSSGPITNKGQAVVFWGENNQLTEPLPYQADVQVDVAAGDWKVNKPGRSALYPEFTNLPDRKVIILSGLRPNPKEGMVVKTLIEATTTSIDVDIQLECITTGGKTHTSWYEGSLIQEGQLIQHTFGFAIPIQNIEKIKVKHRKFYRVEFKNVSLKPGIKTDVQVDGGQLSEKTDEHLAKRFSSEDVAEENKPKIILRASVFSVRTPPSSITNFLYNELGLKNTPIIKLTDAQAEQFKKWMASIPNTTTATSPTAIVFDRQTADLSVTTQHEYTMDYEESADSPAGYKPKRKKFTTGVQLNLTPELKQNKNLIILTLKLKKTDLVKLESKLHPSGNQVQVPVIQTSETRTTIAVQQGKYLLALLSGMSSRSNSNQPDKPVQKTILLVKADVQVEVEGGAGKQLSSGGGYQNLSREQRERLERLRANRQSLSYNNMQKLGLAVAVFANDHNGRCPSNLSDLRRYIGDEQIFDWINRNVVYLGKNREYRAPPDVVLAYDESMLKKTPQETNVLYNDAHVALVSSKWLKEIGIRLER